MKKRKGIFRSLLWVGMGAFFFLACQPNAAQFHPTPNLTPSPSVQTRYWEIVRQAQDAYTKADYEKAINLARQAAGLDPGEQTAWELYDQAVIALAGESYLSELPEYRYQLPVSVFIRDRVNHSRDWLVIDVREPDEYSAGHIQGAINIPLREILQNLQKLPSSKSAPILLYCHSQKRATHALVILHELGYIKTFNLEGGYATYEDWMSHNPLPTPGPTPTPGPDEPDFGC